MHASRRTALRANARRSLHRRLGIDRRRPATAADVVASLRRCQTPVGEHRHGRRDTGRARPLSDTRKRTVPEGAPVVIWVLGGPVDDGAT